MKKAFTMIELVMVIIVAGILAAMAFPRMNDDNIYQAANQVASHIRYTQHLAMQDNQFNPNDPQWFKGRWQFFVSRAKNTISYMIFSDTRGGTGMYQGNPTGSSIGSVVLSEVAVNPEDPTRYLIGAPYSTFFGDSDRVISRKLDLKRTFGIEAVSITGGNSGSAQSRIFFDNFGRPFRGYNKAIGATNPYGDMYLLRTQLQIHLCTVNPCPTSDGKDRITIAIEPETGYTHIL